MSQIRVFLLTLLSSAFSEDVGLKGLHGALGMSDKLAMFVDFAT